MLAIKRLAALSGRMGQDLPHSVVEVASTHGGPLLIIRGAGASLTLAFAPRCVVGVFRVHVFGQAMLEVDCCHCVALFVSVSHKYIIPSLAQLVKLNSNFSCPAIKFAGKFNVRFIIVKEVNHIVILDDAQQNFSLCLRNVHACV